MQLTITAMIETIRAKIEQADYNSSHQIGDILIALSLITDVIETQEKRHEQYVNRMDMIINRISR